MVVKDEKSKPTGKKPKDLVKPKSVVKNLKEKSSEKRVKPKSDEKLKLTIEKKSILKSASATKTKLSLAYGKVKYKALLSRGKWRLINKAEAEKSRKKQLAKGIKPKPKRRANIIEKPIKGEKNGGTRKIHLKRKNYYAAEKKPKKHRTRGLYSLHKRHFRSSLTPGTILILLAGVNKGKRVVLLRCLPSGLLLVTGPFKLNGVPLRRVQQCHVIGTKTKLDISELKIPDTVSDSTFKRVVEKVKIKKGDKTVFVPRKKTYRPTSDRKELQKVVDEQVLAILKKHPDRKIMYAYLASMFGLRNNQYPHRLQY